MTTELVKVSFRDFEDLQTRLILLPKVEEQGVGAIVALYTEQPPVPTSDEASATEPKATESETEPTTPEMLDLVDHVLIGLESTAQEELESKEWREKDFSDILAAIREAPCPIHLLFEAPFANTVQESNRCEADYQEEKKDELESPGQEETLSESASTTSSHASCAPDGEDDDSGEASQDGDEIEPSSQSSMLGDRLSSWTTRMRATSAQLASEAASGAASISTAVATAAKERAKNNRIAAEAAAASVETTEPGAYRMFLQSSMGAFLPVEPLSPNSSPELRVTNSSLVVVRISATEPCAPRGLSLQWYRSDSGDWLVLEGATYSSFQPSATEVGHRLRCVVVVEKLDDDSDDERDRDNDSRDEGGSERHVCETPDPVSAALALFNGARQAIVRGAQFGGLQGRGNAEGRIFRLKIEMTFLPNTESSVREVTSSVTIYQVSGATAEPIHPEDEPITAVTALCDYSNAKLFELSFPAGLPESASMVSALCTNGCFQLQAPNRLARESLLLTIGIANYAGEPADLDATTMMFGSEEKVQEEGPQEDVAVPPETLEPDEADDFVDEDASQRSSSEHASQVLSLRDDHAAHISALKRDFATKEAALKNNHALQLSSLKRDHDAHTLTLNRKHDSQVSHLKSNHSDKVSKLENCNDSFTEKIAELEKAVRTLQNEKALLSAAVEARESKLSKMSELQTSFDELTVKVEERDTISSNLDEATRRYRDVASKLETVSKSEVDCKAQLDNTQKEVEELNKRLVTERTKSNACKAELEPQQIKIQKLIAERNSYKQKGDSLAKEIGRICKNGRTVRHVEKVLADDLARREEVTALREQKRKALEDLQHYRTAYEQSRMAQKMAGLDHDSANVLERNAELERLLSELSEYLNAKEMQLETYKQVNDALQLEIRDLAKANMSSNDI